MVEAKHKYFLIQNDINQTVSPSSNVNIYPNGEGYPMSLRYIGKYRRFTYCEGKNEIDSNRGDNVRAYNFQLLFGPDEMLPDNQGTGADQFVGHKFNWKNTVFSMQYDPSSYIMFMRRIQGQSYGTTFLPEQLSRFTTPAHIVNVDLDHYVKRDSGGHVLLGDYSTANYEVRSTSFSAPTYQVGNKVVMGRLASSEQELANKGIHVPQQTSEETKAYNLTLNGLEPSVLGNSFDLTAQTQFPYALFPLLMSPQFRFYYYTRIVVFKFKLPMANFNSLYHSWDHQMNFLNSLWWQRNLDETKPNYSIRSNVLNDNNPYAGTFQIVYNKLIKINPAKRYIFRFNFGSRKRKGDLITLKTGDPFNPVPDLPSVDHIYSNGCYLGFMLPPVHPDDFDWFGSNVVESNFAWKPYTNNTHSKMVAVEYPTDITDPNSLDGPYLPVYQNEEYTNHNVGQTLNLGSIYLSGRTCFLD